MCIYRCMLGWETFCSSTHDSMAINNGFFLRPSSFFFEFIVIARICGDWNDAALSASGYREDNIRYKLFVCGIQLCMYSSENDIDLFFFLNFKINSNYVHSHPNNKKVCIFHSRTIDTFDMFFRIVMSFNIRSHMSFTFDIRTILFCYILAFIVALRLHFIYFTLIHKTVDWTKRNSQWNLTSGMWLWLYICREVFLAWFIVAYIPIVDVCSCSAYLTFEECIR